MRKLIVIPTQNELDPFLAELNNSGLETNSGSIGRIPTFDAPELDATIAPGGFGKVQFAVQTQHLIDAGPQWTVVVCAGVSGALSGEVSIGDIVVGTETIEHDTRFSSGNPLPRFAGSKKALAELRLIDIESATFDIHFAAIASGDEDVIGLERRSEIHKTTGALAVAWEGAGGARASEFSGLPFVEIRGISDMADQTLGSDFHANLPPVMQNIARLISAWCGS